MHKCRNVSYDTHKRVRDVNMQIQVCVHTGECRLQYPCGHMSSCTYTHTQKCASAAVRDRASLFVTINAVVDTEAVTRGWGGNRTKLTVRGSRFVIWGQE